MKFIRSLPNNEDKKKYRQRLQSVRTGWPFGDGYYDRCFFGGSFEILDVETFRSKSFMDYFEWLDRAKGFMFKRWSDGLVRTLAVQMFLEPDEVWKVDNIGYRHRDVCR